MMGEQSHPWLTTQFTAGPTTVKEMLGTLLPRRLVLYIALIVLVILAVAELQGASNHTRAKVFLMPFVIMLLLWFLRRIHQTTLAKIYFPGARWAVEFFEDRFALHSPAATTVIRYEKVRAIVVKQRYVLLKQDGSTIAARRELFPDQALHRFPQPR